MSEISITPAEFSIGIMRRMSPAPVDWLIAKVGRCPYTHIVLLLKHNGQPHVYHSHPRLPFGPFQKSGPQRHTYEEYTNVIIPYWSNMPWARGQIEHTWIEPPIQVPEHDAVNARIVADWLVDRSAVKYGLFINWLVKLPGFMHCSEFVAHVLQCVGLRVNKSPDRVTPCDVYRLYVERQVSQHVHCYATQRRGIDATQQQ